MDSATISARYIQYVQSIMVIHMIVHLIMGWFSQPPIIPTRANSSLLYYCWKPIASQQLLACGNIFDVIRKYFCCGISI